MRYKVIAVVVAVVVVAAAGAATLVDRTPTMRYVAQHEDTSVPRADAHQGLSIDPETFSSHLPVIAIDTHGQEIPGDVLYVDGEPIIREDGRTVLTTTPEGATDAQVDVRVYDARDGSPNTLDGTPALESKALIHYRGHRSREFAKRNYSLHLIDDEGMPRDEKVAGMASENAWVLNGPYLDKSLIRNYMAYTLGQHLHVLAPDVRFCELFVDGEYRGLFLIMESVKEASNRVNLSEPTGKGDATSYLLKMDRPDLDALEIRRRSCAGSSTVPPRPPVRAWPSPASQRPTRLPTRDRREWITPGLPASSVEKSARTPVRLRHAGLTGIGTTGTSDTFGRTTSLVNEIQPSTPMRGSTPRGTCTEDPPWPKLCDWGRRRTSTAPSTTPTRGAPRR